MPDQASNGSDDGFIALEPAAGGGVSCTYEYPPGTVVRRWAMSRDQALGLVARTLVLLRYRELHVRQDLTVSLAEEWMGGEDVPTRAGLDLGDALIDMAYETGGSVRYIFSSPPGTAVLCWVLSRSRALQLASRTTGLLGHRELHVDKDFSVSRVG